MISPQQRKRRDRLFLQDPKCRFCHVQMVHPKDIKQGDPAPKNMLTLEHLNTRASLERENVSNKESTTICCFACNQKRGKKAQTHRIFIKDFRTPELSSDVYQYLIKKGFAIKDNQISIHVERLGQMVIDLKHNHDVMFNDNMLIIDRKGMCFKTTLGIRKQLMQRGKNLLELVKHLITSGV